MFQSIRQLRARLLQRRFYHDEFKRQRLHFVVLLRRGHALRPRFEKIHRHHRIRFEQQRVIGANNHPHTEIHQHRILTNNHRRSVIRLPERWIDPTQIPRRQIRVAQQLTSRHNLLVRQSLPRGVNSKHRIRFRQRAVVPRRTITHAHRTRRRRSRRITVTIRASIHHHRPRVALARLRPPARRRLHLFLVKHRPIQPLTRGRGRRRHRHRPRPVAT
mmetsp:Transcript_7624/g.27932  ORF Transcript_7624/g.27932 Transcript_7624/m.27932 type:complete len:217 (+) Transcript_7624:1147-1797(+)